MVENIKVGTDDEINVGSISLPVLKGKDGKDGAEGPRGPQGDRGEQGLQGERGPAGADGKAGYSPVKGVDYFTEAEKTEFVNKAKYDDTTIQAELKSVKEQSEKNTEGITTTNENLEQAETRITELESENAELKEKVLGLESNQLKGTAEGTSITVNDSAEMRTEIGIAGGYSQEGTPSPDSPVEIDVVDGLQKIVVGNRNLFDSYSLEGLTTDSQNTSTEIIDKNNIRFINWGTWSRKSFNVCNLKPNTTYIISATIIPSSKATGGFYIDDKSSDTAFSKKGAKSSYIYQTFTTDENGKKKITFYTNWSSTYDSSYVYFNNIQLEEGTIATDYIEHQSQEYELLLDKLELFKDDYIYKENGKWFVKKLWEKVVLDGSENWAIGSINIYGITNFNMAYSFDKNLKSGAPILEVFSNRFIRQDTGIAITETVGMMIKSDIMYLRMKDITTKDVLRKWLAENKPYIYYKISQPTTTEITSPILIEQLEKIEKEVRIYKGVTHIDTEEGLMKLELNYNKSLEIVLENMQNAIVSLGENV